MLIMLYYCLNYILWCFFFLNDPATTEMSTYLHTLSLHDALPILDVGHPVEADVDVRRAFPASRQVEVAPARSAAADEDGIEVLREQFLHRIDAPVADELDAQVEDVAAFLVDHLDRKSTRLNSSH